jgi:hypothetical protein
VSVRGEFVRIVGDAVACLRGQGSAPADTLAEDLELARRAAPHDLSGAATRVLELLDAAPESLRARTAGDDPLADAAERARAVSRAILGR